ncbi:RagB/SusD family nutrient uptake outer membrane protein [Halalkalibaculum sp. DA3122]|uniref:RagB/SusD family nutrient uptake outer membrane protein n=2 Tax=unclassified Halalkalibaculum TaxID=2964617 RepID=UPI003754DD99
MLDVEPKGVVTEEQVSEPESLEGLVTAAYAFTPKASPCCAEFMSLNPWIASVRSDDAYKGGGGLDDQTPWYQMETFSLVSSSIGNNNGVWKNGYHGIARANEAISKIQEVDESEFPVKTTRLAEMHFIRAWLHYKLKIRYRWIPYVPEGLTQQEIEEIPNRRPDAENDMYIWQHILDDFKYASENLPETQEDDGRVNKATADAFIVKTLLWMAYPQDDNHQLTNINTSRLEEALTYANEIINSGQYSLAEDFAHNFMYEWDNQSPEVLWELQFSTDDGTPNGNLNEGNSLTTPWWSPYFSCCDFHKPSFNMVNAFKVDQNGLPMFDTFNDESAQGSYNNYFSNNTFDPRIGHTVAIPGLPWKYQNQQNPVLFDSAGSRQPDVYGYFHSLKENVRTDSPGLVDLFWMHNSKNQAVVRYDEVLLMKAEILIELGRHDEALPIINQIRQRASNSTGMLTFTDGSPTLDYNIETYQDGVNINWTQQNARKALRWERRLELAMEGRRFFDLVRWGIAEEVMNDYFEKERERRQWLSVAEFQSGRDEYRPIPQEQLNLSEGVYTQNPGY